MHVAPFDPALSPALLAQRLADLPGVCWLDGAAAHAEARYSFLAAEPIESVHAPLSVADPLAMLARIEQDACDNIAASELSGAPSPCDVPRWIGYVAYDACFAGGRGRLPRPSARPALVFARYDAVLVVDHAHGTAFVAGDDAAACERLRARLQRPARPLRAARAGAPNATAAEHHRAAIARALEHIARGDLYQANLARCWQASFAGDPLALWHALRAASAVPFGFYFDDGARVVMARTMERFLHWQRDSRALRTRPIKGTIARAGDRDAQEAATLRADAKERAEHAMIVDLMRNDLGRVAEIGSVRVAETMAVEPFARLSHLVSTVACRTRADVSLRDVLRATFPPGSVTGAPKLRAIDLIEQLESEPRDVYTGALGFVDRAGGLSLAVAIRTALLENGGVRFFAGGGIVEASQIERELAETELKARVFFDALAALGSADGDFELSRPPLLRYMSDRLG
jgi:anthranilate/para-aminobenzoate synthase component I